MGFLLQQPEGTKTLDKVMSLQHYDSANGTEGWGGSCDLLKAGFAACCAWVGEPPTGSAQPTCPLPLAYSPTLPRGLIGCMGQDDSTGRLSSEAPSPQKGGLDTRRDSGLF